MPCNSQIVLNDDSFWQWMYPEESNSGVYAYLSKIADNELDSAYVVEVLKESSIHEQSSIMANLCLCMPRRYFLEIQSCIRTYATLFGRVFPPLVSHVDQLAYIEWLLYTEPGDLRYRDHLVHMFKVAFVADQLLSLESISSKITEYQYNSDHFKKWCKARKFQADKWDPETQKDILKIAFFLAALFHDFGYGYYFLRKYKGRLFRLYRWLLPGADPTDIDAFSTKIILQSLPSFFVKKHHSCLDELKSKDSDKNVLAGFYHDCLPLNHSIASAFFVLDLAEQLGNARALNEKLYVAFQIAAEACMIHDMTKENKWVHLRPNSNQHFITCDNHEDIPLAMLLILADELSIWNRPTLKVKANGDNCVFCEMHIVDVPTEVEILLLGDGDKHKIKITVDNFHENLEKSLCNDILCLKLNTEEDNCQLLGYLIEVSGR